VGAPELRGCARLELAQGVVPLNPREAVFEGMLAGWALRDGTCTDMEARLLVPGDVLGRDRERPTTRSRRQRRSSWPPVRTPR
jgi:hypothetical protein